ncbi:MAG: pentapeptide repeat-containing protein [Ktedonobacteraceae bacterium]|nr:pentapeptide repeat-containing protein [Ktedonobacteraceae bacterium]
MTEQVSRREDATDQQQSEMDDRIEWQAYWRAQGQPWRREPEIDEKRQRQLERMRAIEPQIEQSIYPFGGEKLTRADVEWLLATHEQGRGPIDWSDLEQRKRKGIDLRGADLSKLNLRYLPLARLQAGIYWYDSEQSLTPEHMRLGATNMEGVDLREAHLEGASLGYVNLRRAVLYSIRLDEAMLRDAHMQDAVLYSAHLDNADLKGAHLEGAYMFRTQLSGANLQEVFFDATTDLTGAMLGEKKQRFISLAGAHWGGVDISVINWSQVGYLGDEEQARQPKNGDGTMKDAETRLQEYRTAVRANRQVAVALREQGMNEEAMPFAYRAQMLQRSVYRRQRQVGRYLFSLFLDALAGYGYKPTRCFTAYACAILAFATAYYLLGPASHLQFTPIEAVVFSMISFHGRGFAPSISVGIGSLIAILTAVEALVGIIIELTLIATLTQRLFSR